MYQGKELSILLAVGDPSFSMRQVFTLHKQTSRLQYSAIDVKDD